MSEHILNIKYCFSLLHIAELIEDRMALQILIAELIEDHMTLQILIAVLKPMKGKKFKTA